MADEDRRFLLDPTLLTVIRGGDGGLHRDLPVAAASEGQSLNEWAVRTLSENVADG